MANLSSILGGAFDPSTVVATQTDFAVLPKGDYRVTITGSEISPLKNGNGQMLTLKVVTEENRVIFDNLCVVHTNATAQSIAQTKLKQITESLLIKQVSDSSQLHDKPLIAHVTVELDKYRTEQAGGEKVFRNNVSGYSPAKTLAPTSTNTASADFMSDDVPF